MSCNKNKNNCRFENTVGCGTKDCLGSQKRERIFKTKLGTNRKP